MKRNQKIILGGGISGLLQAYYNPEALLVSDQIGGQLKAPFQLGPKYLHVDEYSKRFFSEIGLNPNIKKIKIGFLYDGEFHNTNTEENRKLYFQKTREKNEPYHSSMSADMTEFDSFDIDTDDIVDLLKEKIKNKIIIGKVEKIDNRFKEITVNGETIKYEKLISTIPLNIFLYLNNKAEIAKSFKSFPTTFILDEIVWDIEDYDYVYVSEPCYPFHRITKTESGTVLEFKGDNISEIVDN